MKKIVLIVFLTTTFFALLQPIHATSSPDLVIPINEPAVSKPGPYNDILIRQFLSLTPRKYYELSGKRMSLLQKISLKLAQHKVKRMLKKGEPVDLVAMSKGVDTSDFNLPGFALGLILSVFGVLIAYLIDDTDANMIKWAWIGAAVGAILILLLLIL